MRANGFSVPPSTTAASGGSAKMCSRFVASDSQSKRKKSANFLRHGVRRDHKILGTWIM